MENFNTATEVKDEQLVNALPLSADEGDDGDDSDEDPVRSLPRPSKPVQPDNQARSEATDIDGDRSLRPSQPRQLRSEATDIDGGRSLRPNPPSPAHSEGTDHSDDRRLRPTRPGPSNPRLLA